MEIRGRVTQVLTLLDSAEQPQELDLPGLYLHGMSGRFAGHWSVRITANLRITFRFEGVDVADVDMLDYH